MAPAAILPTYCDTGTSSRPSFFSSQLKMLEVTATSARPPLWGARASPRQPVGERAGAGNADLLALEVGDAVERRIPRHGDADERDRRGGGVRERQRVGRGRAG